MLGTFPKAFSQRQLPHGIFPGVNFPKLQIPKRQLSQSVITTALGP